MIEFGLCAGSWRLVVAFSQSPDWTYDHVPGVEGATVSTCIKGPVDACRERAEFKTGSDVGILRGVPLLVGLEYGELTVNSHIREVDPPEVIVDGYKYTKRELLSFTAASYRAFDFNHSPHEEDQRVVLSFYLPSTWLEAGHLCYLPSGISLAWSERDDLDGTDPSLGDSQMLGGYQCTSATVESGEYWTKKNSRVNGVQYYDLDMRPVSGGLSAPSIGIAASDFEFEENDC